MKKIIALLIPLLLIGSLAAQTSTGGVTFSTANGGPPPPNPPQITSGAPGNGVQGAAYTFTFVACCGTLPYNWSSVGTLPAGTTLTTVANQGVLSGTLGAVGNYSFNITVTDGAGLTASAPYTVQIVASSPPTITNGTPPGGFVGSPYLFTFTASGAAPPFTFSKLSGTFPTGTSLVGATGVLSGTPSAAGTFTFVIRVTDFLGVTADSPSYSVIITNPSPQITNPAPPNGTTGNAYTTTFTACCGTAPYTWSSTGLLPNGLTLSPTSGVMSGTLGTPATYSFTIIVTDVNGLTASQPYTLVILPVIIGGPALPISWPNPHELDGTTSHVIMFPADGLSKHGGTPYANTQAGVNSAIADANAQRDADGSGTWIKLPHNSPFVGLTSMSLVGSNTTTGLNSRNAIIIDSDTPLPDNQTVCSHGTQDTDRKPGCTNDAPSMWVWSQSNSNNVAISCNASGTSGPAHHYLVKNGEIRNDSSGPVSQTSGIGLVFCGTNSETSEAQQPSHMQFQQNYFHGYDTPEISAPRGIFYSWHDSVIAYNYMEMLHWSGGGEGQGIATQQSARVLVLANWIEGGAEGSMIGGGEAVIPNYTPSDFVFRRNMFTRNYADKAISNCVTRTKSWDYKNRFEIKNGQRVLIDGNSFMQSWCDGQDGRLVMLNVRSCSVVGCTGGNNSTVSDITFTNNVLAHGSHGIQTDAASGGPSNGNGQSLKGRRWLFKNNIMYDIGDYTRYPADHLGGKFTSVAFQLGASGQTISCNLTRNGGGTIATAVCSSTQTNVPGTGMAIGDPVKLTGCTPDSSFNVGSASVGPPVLTGSPSSLTFTFANTGAASGTATCNLDNSVGAPQTVTIDHNSIFMAWNSDSQFITLGDSPVVAYPRSNVITNNLFLGNGGNPGGFGGSGGLEGTGEENLWDISTLQFNSNVLTGRNPSVYTTYQNGQAANSFPGNSSGGSNNQTGVVCTNELPTSSCVGIANLVNGVAYNAFTSNPADFHALALRIDSTFAAGQAKQATDGTSMGADLVAIDSANRSKLYNCTSPCGNGPFPDAGGAFMVATAGDNVDGCTGAKPCDSFAAIQAAVQALPVDSRAVLMHGGTYRLASTLNFAAADGGTPQEDLMDWFCTPYPLRTTSHLHSTGINSYCYMDADGQKFWLLKSATGNPWDIHTYDSTNIYFWITENGDIPGGFNNPNAFKRKVTPTPIAPRFFTPGTVVKRTTIGPAGQSNPGQPTANCYTDSLPTTYLGDTQGITSGPTTIAWGNSVGTQPTILIEYFYSGNNGSYNSRERFYLVKGFGWVFWDVASCSGTCTPDVSTYTVSNSSDKTTVVTGGAPTPNWPCGTAFPWWIGGTTVGAGGNAAAQAGPAPPQQTVTYESYPGENATITGQKKVTGFASAGSCGTNCTDYTVTLPSASWVNFESLWYNGVRRPRPQARGMVHGYFANACPTTTNDDAALCVSGGGGHTQTQADIDCACPAAVTSSGGHCAGSQTKICTVGGATPFQCFNKFKYSGSDISGTWHGIGVGDVEVLNFESWTMARMRLLSASAGVANFTGSTALSNDHGCMGGHQYIAENVKENMTKGQWYLDRDANNDGVLDANWILHVPADTSIGENPTTADIEVSQLPFANPQVVNGSSVNSLTLQNLTFTGDNWLPDVIGLGDQQGSPSVTSALTFTTSNNITLNNVTVGQTNGWGVTFQAGGSHPTIQNSYFKDLGDGAMRFETGSAGKVAAQGLSASVPDTDLNVPQYGLVINNLIDHPNRIVPTGYGNGIFTGDVHHFTITHNEIVGAYTGGIELCFGLKRSANDDGVTQQFFCHDNLISFNLISGQNNALMSDFGGIYGATSYSTACPAGTPATGNPCNRVVNNVIHDMYNNYDLTSSATSSGARGIYFDQGSTNNLAQNNLVYRAGHSCGFNNLPQITSGVNQFLAQNNLWDNNIFAYCGYINPAFTENLSKAVLAKNGKNGNAFTFSHNISYVNLATSLGHFQNLSGPYACFADDGTTAVACATRFLYANNAYWNTNGSHPITFATCKTAACSSPFNGTNYFQYTANGAIPACWTNPWIVNGCSAGVDTAGEDAGSVAVDPVFVNPAAGDFHYMHSFAGQGIQVFDYTQAGRQTTTYSVDSTIPDLFPVRAINIATDFTGTNTTPATLTTVSPAQGFAAGGESVTLTGTNFDPAATVTIGGVSATTVFVNPTTLTVTAPVHATGVTDVSVTNPGTTPSTKTGGYQYLSTATTTCNFVSTVDQTCTLTYTDQYGSQTRTTRIIMPTGLGANPSLVIYYHGSLVGTGTSECENGGWVAKATAIKFIMLCPQGVQINPGAGNNTRSWNSYFNGATYDIGHPPDDSMFNRELIALLYKRAAINPKQVFLTGFSSGAHGAYSYSVDAPAVVAAVGVEAGVLLTQPPSPGNLIFPNSTAPVSVIELQGTADASFNYCGTNGVVKQTSVDDLFTYYTGANGDVCTTTTGAALCTGFLGTPTASTSRKGTSCSGGTEVRVYQLLGATHQFYGPGTIFAASGGNATTPSNPELAGTNTVDTLWSFFSTHAKQ